MTKVTKRTLTIVLVFVLALAVFAAPAYAFFTAVVTAHGEQETSLNYSFVIEEDIEKDDTQKKITLVNTGDSDIMVRVHIFYPELDDVTITTEGEGWVYNEDSSTWDCVYPIKSGDPSVPLYVKVDSKRSLDDMPSFNVTVVGQASPVAYDEKGDPHGYLWDKVQ